MNNFWVGFKNKKGIFLAILALFTVATSVLDNHHQAYADDYQYSKEECEKMGFKYDGTGFNTAAGAGCLIEEVKIVNGKVDVRGSQTIGGPKNLVDLRPIYALPEGKSCVKGYTQKKYDNHKVCELTNKKSKDAGYVSGSSSKDAIDAKSCEKAGGYYNGNGGDKMRCFLNNMKGDLEPFNNFSSFPSKYLTKGDCAPGYIKSKDGAYKDFTEGDRVRDGRPKQKTAVFVCAKKGTKAGDSVEECNKEENKDSEKCKDNPAGDDDGDGSKDKNSCAIEWVGWIMCPVIRGANSMVVSTYSLMQQHFLNIKADEIFQQDKPAFKTWSSFRDIANVFFVIILSIIIFSQVSGVGISNYGIKKMLPKIIVFAILVNISWYVSVIMIDISNILGHSLYEWLSGDGTWQYSSDSQQDTSPVEGILSGAAIGVGTAAAVSGTLAGSTSILMFIFSAALALIMMVFILLIRQAAVIVLVVVSPVAFVAGILPNTEGVFKKWIKFFKNMLMIYPICSLIVGGSIFVSNLLYNNESSPLLKIAYGLLPILSLFTIVAIIKSVLSIIDGLTGGNLRGTLDKMSGKLTNATANSRPLKRAEEFQRNLKFKGVALGKDAREAKYQANKANRTYNRNRRELNKLLNKDNQTAADFRQITRLGGEIGAHEKAQSEGMVSAMTTAIGGNVGNVAGQLRMVASATDPDQQRLMYGALSQAVTNAGLGAAAQSSALGDVVDSALNTSDATQRQAIMSQIASKSGAEIKKVNPAAAKAAMQNVANKDNIKSVSDFEKEVSTYAGASAQQMAGWSAMSSSNTADNKALDAMEKAFASGDQTQIGHAQSMGKVADQALNANSKGTMFLTPDQQKNFQAMSNLAKEHDPVSATSSSASTASVPAPTPAPVPAGSQNMQVGVNYSVNSNSQASQYGAPAPTQQVVVDQYKSNRRFGPQRSK